VSRLSLLWRGAWSRKGFSVALFALGVITMAAAAIGPLYARAARESILTDTLSSAPAGQTGVSYSFRTDVAGSGSISAALRTARGPAVPKGFAAPIMAVDAHGLIVYGEVSGQQIRASADLAWLPRRVCPSGRDRPVPDAAGRGAGQPADAGQLVSAGIAAGRFGSSHH